MNFDFSSTQTIVEAASGQLVETPAVHAVPCLLSTRVTCSGDVRKQTRYVNGALPPVCTRSTRCGVTAQGNSLVIRVHNYVPLINPYESKHALHRHSKNSLVIWT